MTTYDEDFEQVDACGSLTTPSDAGSVKKGSYMLINGRPCKVVDYSTAKTGKHGHAKASILAVDIFNGRKCEDSLPCSHNVDVPNLTRTEYQVISVDDEGYVTLMHPKTNEVRQDIKLPDDIPEDAVLVKRLYQALEDGKDTLVTVLGAMGIEKIVDVQEKN